MKRLQIALVLLVTAAPSLAIGGAAAADATLAGVTNAYQKIADTIIAANHSEEAIVQAILQVERDSALAALDRAKAGGTGAAAELRTAATRIGDFATEGGAAVEPIRTRLLQAGHHHNADDTGPNAVFDEGYVVVNKKVKVELLDLAKRCAKLADAAKADPAEIGAIRDGLSAAAAKVLPAK